MPAGAGRGSFSSPDERSAAAGLLLLSSSPNTAPSSASSSASRSSPSSRSAASASGLWSHHHVAMDSVAEECHSSSSTSSSPFAPFSSSSTVSDPAHEVCRELQADPLRMLTLAARCIDDKRKVVKKARSAVIYGSISKKSTINEKLTPLKLSEQKYTIHEDPDPSCLSSTSTIAAAIRNSPTFSGSSSSGVANSSSHGGIQISQKLPPSSPPSAISRRASSLSNANKPTAIRTKRVAVSSGSNGVRKRAEAILNFLCKKGCISEVKIRAVLGDSPDTSKALRMLVKLDQVKRSGTGGRQSPFLYRVSESFDGSIL